MSSHHQVFLSSTFKDLEDSRRSAIEALLRNRCFPVAMELFGADPDSSWKVIRELIAASDYFVLLLGERYGSLLPGEEVSITEREYDFAVSRQVPCAAIKCNSDLKGLPAETDDQKKAQARFVAKVTDSLQIGRALSPAVVASEIGNAMNTLRSKHPRVGWIREDNRFVQHLWTEGAFRAQLAEFMLGSSNRVVFENARKSGKQTWVFELLPAIMDCRRRNVSIDVVVADTGAMSESFEFLKGLGCNVSVPKRLTAKTRQRLSNGRLSGVFFDPSSDESEQYVCISPDDQGGASPYATVLRGNPFRALVAERLATFQQLSSTQTRLGDLAPIPDDTLVSRLRRASHYGQKGVEIRLEPVSVAATRPTTRSVVRAKAVQVKSLIASYRDAGIGLFQPAAVPLSKERWSILVPPVLETLGNGLFRVIEGHTRLHSLYQDKVESVTAVVVDGCTAPWSPGQFEWDMVAVVDDRSKAPGVYARGVENAVHMLEDRMEFISSEEVLGRGYDGSR